MPNYFDPSYTAITSPLGSEEISPVRDLLNGLDKSITLNVLKTWTILGLPAAPAASAPLLGSTSGSVFQTITLGRNLSLTGTTLNDVVPASAPLLGSTSGAIFQSITLGTNLSLAGTTLNATSSPTIASAAQTSSYTFVLGDAGAVVEMNVASANNATVPPNSSVAFPVGTLLMICQIGAGQTTVVSGAGVTIRNPGTALTARGQWSTLSLRQRAANEWVLSGDMT